MTPAVASPRPLHKIANLLAPRSAAVIGVSERMNPGHIILNNMLREGFDRAHIFVIKTGGESIEGCRCVPTVAALPEKVDLLIVSVDAVQAAAVVDEVTRLRKAESIIMIPGGLEEKQGTAELVGKIRDTLARSRQTDWQGPILNGANCLGIRSRPGRYDTLFIPQYKLASPKGPVAPVAILSQSGALAIVQASRLSSLNPKYLISVGNQTDLSLADYLTFLADDLGVRVFACYVEGMTPDDEQRFLAAAKDVRRSGRAVLLYAAGRSAAGIAAVASHTGSPAGDAAAFAARAREVGVVVAGDLVELEDLMLLFVALGDKSAGHGRLGALSNAGFECVAIADNLGPLSLASFGDGTAAAIKGLFARCRIDRIVDVHNPLDLTPIMDDGLYEETVRAMLVDPAVDVGIVGIVPLSGAINTVAAGDGHAEDLTAETAIGPRLARLAREVDKPWIAVVAGGALYDPLARYLNEHGVPTFRSADLATRRLGQWCQARRVAS